MAKKRLIHTKFWSDSFIRKLLPLERYVFIYLLTNEHTNICGIYEIPIDLVSFELSLSETDCMQTLTRLVPKIYYFDDWVYIRNFAKHQLDNPSIRQGIENVKSQIPENILSKIKQIDTDWVQTAPSVSTVCEISKSKLEPKLKLKSESKSELKVSQTPFAENDMFDIFYKINPTINFGDKTQRKTVISLMEKFGKEKALSMASAAVECFGKPYAPVITNPYELYKNLSKLVAYYKREKNNKITIGKI